MAGKGVVRSIKNYAKGFSEVQIKVREATSNDPNGPSGPLMNDIAQHTFNEHDFIEIMDMIDKRLNDKGKNWRHVFKALVLLDFCLHVGSQNVVLYAKENVYVIRTLKEFQHVDESRRDVGHNVRQKAKELTLLLMNDEKLKEERNNRNYLQEQMSSNSMSLVRRNNGEPDVYRNPGYMDEERDLKRAIDESRRLAEQESRKRGEGDSDLARAIQESEQEARESEIKKKDQLDKENFNNLFAPPTITGGQGSMFNTAFPSQPNPHTSPNPYLQNASLWPQSTGMSFAEPITAKNPYHTSPQTFSHLNGSQGTSHSNGLQTPTSFYGAQPQNSFNGLQTQNNSGGLAAQNSFNGLQTQNSLNALQAQNSFNGLQTQNSFNGQTQNSFGGLPAQNSPAQNSLGGSQAQSSLNALQAQNSFNGLQAQMTGFPTGNYGSNQSAYYSPFTSHAQPVQSQRTGFQPTSQSAFQPTTPSGFHGLGPMSSNAGFQSTQTAFQPSFTGFGPSSSMGGNNPFGQSQATGQDRFNTMLMNHSR